MKQFLLCSRPVSWPNTAGPFLLAYAWSVHQAGAPTASTMVTGAIGFVFFLIPFNLALYGINDVFDYASDLTNPRKGGVEGAVLAPQYHRLVLMASAVSTVPFVVYLLWIGSATARLALIGTMFTVIAYSAPHLRFKERPALDSFTSATHFVGPAVVGLTLGGSHLTHDVWICLLGFLLWAMASHAFGAVQDIRSDRSAGIRSVATALGAKWTVRCAIFLYIAGALPLVTLPMPVPAVAALVIPYIVVTAPFWSVADTDCEQTNAGWRHFLLLNFIAGFLLSEFVFWHIAS